MNWRLFSAVALALSVIALGIGCGAERPTLAPFDEPTAVQTPRDPTPEAKARPTAIPQSEAGETVATPSPAPTAPASPSAAQDLVAQARQDLAQRLEVPTEAIELVSVEAVAWPDAGLGCPQPGMAYAQVVTPGFVIVLDVEGRTYEYHTDAGRRVVCCECKEASMRTMPTVPGPVESDLEHVVDLVKADAAERLSVAVDEIVVVEARSVVWPDGSLGCPQPGMMYTQALVPGYRIVLRVGEREMDYHASKRGHFVLCERPGLPPDLLPDR